MTAKLLQRRQAGVSLRKEEMTQEWGEIWDGLDSGQDVRTPHLLLQLSDSPGKIWRTKVTRVLGRTFGERRHPHHSVSSPRCPRSL